MEEEQFILDGVRRGGFQMETKTGQNHEEVVLCIMRLGTKISQGEAGVAFVRYLRTPEEAAVLVIHLRNHLLQGLVLEKENKRRGTNAK